MARLRFGPKRIGISEYYVLELFDDSIFNWRAKEDCIGYRFNGHIDRTLNLNHWMAVAYDKVVAYSILSRLGFPIPEPVATLNRFGRRIHDEPRLSSVVEMLDFLTERRPYPFFIKPIHGYTGVSAYGIRNIDRSGGSVELVTGDEMTLDALVKDIEYEPYGGMLLQPVLRPAAEIESVFGQRLCTLRIRVLLTPQGPRLHSATWKIARHRNMTDHFYSGKHGNMIGWIDCETGRLERVIGGYWPKNQEVLDHPDTGRRMKGFVIRGWREVKDLCLSAGVHFPGLRLQSWDVALCERGPVLVEINTGSDNHYLQPLSRKPFLDETIRSLLTS